MLGPYSLYRFLADKLGVPVNADRPGLVRLFVRPSLFTVEDYEYWLRLSRRYEFHFLPGVLDALKRLNEKGITTIVISNQAGVGKGYFSKEDLDAVTSKMLKEIKKHGGHIERAYYCIHKNQAYLRYKRFNYRRHRCNDC